MLFLPVFNIDTCRHRICDFLQVSVTLCRTFIFLNLCFYFDKVPNDLSLFGCFYFVFLFVFFGTVLDVC